MGAAPPRRGGGSPPPPSLPALCSSSAGADHLHIENLTRPISVTSSAFSVTQGSQELRQGNGYVRWCGYLLARAGSRQHRARGGAPRPHRRDAAAAPKLAKLWLHEDAVLHGSFSPDGNKVVTACADNQAYLFDRITGARLSALPHEEDVVQAQFSPDGKWVLTASRDKTAGCGTLPAAGADAAADARGPLECAYFSPDGHTVLTAGNDRRVRLWDAATGRENGKPLEHEQPVQWAVFSPDGKFIASGGNDRAARVWDAKTASRCSRPCSQRQRPSRGLQPQRRVPRLVERGSTARLGARRRYW